MEYIEIIFSLSVSSDIFTIEQKTALNNRAFFGLIPLASTT